MFIYPIYYHNWRNISTIYIYNKASIKRNILTIKGNTSGPALQIHSVVRSAIHFAPNQSQRRKVQPYE